MKWKVSTLGRTVSSLRELWTGGWSQQPRLRDRTLWAVPPQGPHPQPPSLRVGMHSVHPACERRSLLTGISQGEPSRREIRSENHTRPGQNGATNSSRTPSRRTLSRTPGSRATGGKAYRRSLGHVCTMASSPSGAGWNRECQRGHCAVSWVAKRSTWAWPKHSPYLFHHLGVKHPFPGQRPLSRQGVCPHIEMPRYVNCSEWEEFALGPHKDLVRQPVQVTRPQTSLVVDIRDHRCVVGLRTNTWWPLRSGRKYFRAWNTASISSLLMCQARWWPLHRPRAGWPLMTAPQPVRDASVASVTRRHGAPSTGPWDKNQGCLHMSKARRQRRVTLIMRSGFPLGENPLVLSHHCRGLMYSRPIGITLDAAAIRPSSLWNCLTVSDWPSFTLLTVVRIDSIRAGDIRACIVVESHTTLR